MKAFSVEIEKTVFDFKTRVNYNPIFFAEKLTKEVILKWLLENFEDFYENSTKISLDTDEDFDYIHYIGIWCPIEWESFEGKIYEKEIQSL